MKIELDWDGELFSFNGWISENRGCNERRECEVRRWKSIQVFLNYFVIASPEINFFLAIDQQKVQLSKLSPIPLVYKLSSWSIITPGRK